MNNTRYTVVFIFSPDMQKVLMIHKTKGRFPGMLNGLGGKIEAHDSSEAGCAYREIREEARLLVSDIGDLHFIARLQLYYGTEINAFYAVANDRANPVQCEEERLEWVSLDTLLDPKNEMLAGNGDIPLYLRTALEVEKKRSKK